MKQKVFQTEPGQYPLRGLVARRLFGKFSDTEQQAVGKQIFTGPDGISFLHAQGDSRFRAAFSPCNAHETSKPFLKMATQLS